LGAHNKFRAFSVAMVLLAPGAAYAKANVSASEAAFGTLADGRPVRAVTLENANGISVRILEFGAIIQSLVAPDRMGRGTDIVLGYNDLAGYVTDTNYFGATVGRYANRIAGGSFVLDGKRHTLQRNDGPNALHGGKRGFDKALWKITGVTRGDTASVTLKLVSPDGDESYPGELSVNATFTLDNNNKLRIEYTAKTTASTIVNITGHSYFNLRGENSGQSIMDHRLTVVGDRFTPVDENLIPTGEIRPVAGTAFDFRTPTAIGARIRDGRDRQLQIGRGYDHNYVLNGDSGAGTRLAARIEDPVSGRILEISSDQPGLQFYSGNFLNGTTVGKAGKAYRQGDAFAVEPQVFPDTPNRPAFGSARLEPGQTYRNTIVYSLSVAGMKPRQGR
jgi:aldose 1-epimerase